jgi:hypothetical protein
MAINIDDLYRFVQFIANKEQSGFIKPSEFNLAAESAQMQLFMERYSNPAEYQPGTGKARTGYNQTQKINDDLRIFIKRATLSIDPSGLMQYPLDYMHFSSATHSYIRQLKPKKTENADCEDCEKNTKTKTPGKIKTYTRPIRPVDDMELANLLGSFIVFPSFFHPCLTFYEEGVQYHPKNIGSVDFVYLRKPKKAIWGYIPDANGRPVYDPGTSIDLEWPEQVFNEIAIRILSFVGINLREPELSQYSEGKKQSGI